ncbi:hypothetical protein BH20BAC1_BH20BAC1_19290 [soil metagenome]
MGNKDQRIDDYIKKSADFARPVLIHLRKLIHTGCPKVEETIKWGMPFFDYKGPLCNLAAFKNHCSFGFWKAALLKDLPKMESSGEKGMGHLGKITSLKDLPDDKKILAWIKEAARLNDENIKVTEKLKKEKRKIEMPADFHNALLKDKTAAVNYEKFSPSHKYEYLEWITGAKTEVTRQKRIKTAIEWIREGKSREWRYM